MNEISAYMYEIPLAIRTLRGINGFTQEDLAFLSGYTRNYIGTIERGVLPSIFTTDCIFQALGYTLTIPMVDQVKPKRKQLLMAVTELAEQVGLSTSYLYDIENKRYNGTWGVLKRLAHYLDLPQTILLIKN